MISAKDDNCMEQIVAWEINAHLLHALTNTISMIRAECECSVLEEESQQIAHIREHARNAQYLIDKTRAFSRGALPLRRHGIRAIRDLVLNIISQHQYGKSKVCVDIKTSGCNEKVVVDLELLGVAIRTILTNALKFGLRNTSVIVSARIENQQTLILSVKNESALTAIEFEKWLLPGRSTSKESAGLGLYIASKIIEKMNGDLQGELIGTDVIVHLSIPLESCIEETSIE